MAKIKTGYHGSHLFESGKNGKGKVKNGMKGDNAIKNTSESVKEKQDQSASVQIPDEEDNNDFLLGLAGLDQTLGSKKDYEYRIQNRKLQKVMKKVSSKLAAQKAMNETFIRAIVMEILESQPQCLHHQTSLPPVLQDKLMNIIDQNLFSSPKTFRARKDIHERRYCYTKHY
ncbi:uncharacterized protein CANTADRAFT_19454 [Suhomyces tanzawaensis NRRL Y-17324]|uniref:Uncharacterized protein n=1 Tax=Suhomyces tanzawaensis NRRL Y-17324 TaxID=984487 RepID=A0A1E4SQX9_9ASCO|nr:uncharacterized protein CANTADRAFT_19454 [Suhomyces tanzawaensis NRRL Y-17324]ODV81847.1 hypothetical protein CANTADRAFT_19454 [Suhomyces tanzawaensis NRRL Y-17324]